MDIKVTLKKVMDDYQRITGLRSYLVLDGEDIESASERNYFCKCLKVSSRALKKCDECTVETYSNAREINKECIYSCHAGLIKWAVPINYQDFHCVIVSEGILSQKQKDECDTWVSYLSKQYDLNKEKLKENFEIIATMDQAQMDASIELLNNLIVYHIAFDAPSVTV